MIANIAFAVVAITIVCLIVFVLAVLLQLWLRKPEVWDDRPAAIRGQVLDVNGVPVVIGRSPLLPPQPDDDLLAQAERAAEFEWLKTYLLTSLEQRYLRPGRHRLYAERDPRLAALLEPTQTFAEMVEAETGETLASVGPREAELRCVRTVGFVEAVA